MKRLLTRLALVAVGLTLAVVAAELLLRAFPSVLSEDARLRIHWAGLGASDSNTVAHPTIGYVARSGPDRLERSDLAFDFTIDPNGFRNPWPWPASAEVVVVGDSLSFSYGVDDERGWSDELERRHPDMELVNLAIVGGAPQMAARAFEAYGEALEPKLLIFGLFLGNDVYDAGRFAAWRENDGGEKNFGLWRAFGGRPPGWMGELYRLAGKSYLVAGLRDVKREKNRPPSTLELSGGGRVQLVPDTIGSGFVSGPQATKFRLVANAVEQAHQRCQANGTRLAVLFFPTKEEVYLPLTESDPPDLSVPFAKHFRGLGIDVIDPGPALRAGALEGRQLYFEIDGHPNQAGYDVIADVVDAWLEEQGPGIGLSL